MDPAHWHYFAEGAANLILKSDLPEYYNKLLRMRKLVPGSPTTTDINHFYQTQVLPVLGDYYVGTELVALPAGFVAAINSRPPAEGQRNDKPLDENESHAFLMESVYDSPDYRQESFKVNSTTFTLCRLPITDGTIDDNNSIQEIVLEFKPKWLAPSPNSGDTSLRCRTCALAYKRGKNPGLCPLDLVSNDAAVVERAFAAEFASLSHHIDPVAYPVAEIVAHGLYQSELLDKLKQLQELDGRGILWYDSAQKKIDNDFLTAMAARDCTLFITIKLNYACSSSCATGGVASYAEKIVNVGGTDYPIRLKIADIDLKNPSPEKCQYWTEIERGLIEENWYYKKELPVCTSLAKGTV
jgi:hypothetical protein